MKKMDFDRDYDTIYSDELNYRYRQDGIRYDPRGICIPEDEALVDRLQKADELIEKLEQKNREAAAAVWGNTTSNIFQGRSRCQ